MTTFLHVLADLLIFVMIVINDQRIKELEQRLDNLNERHSRLARRVGRPLT